MLFLTTTSETLSAITSNTVDWAVTYVDMTDAGALAGSAQDSTTGTFTLVGSPAASTQRQVKVISLLNVSGGAVTAQVLKGSVALTSSVPLQAGWKLSYIDTVGWQVLDANGIVKGSGGGSASPLTTKGDLYTYSTSDARLPVGGAGQVLKTNSSTATGLAWGIEQTPTLIPSGETFTVNADSQVLFGSDIEVDGILQINGSLIDVRVPNELPSVSGQAGRFLTNNGSVPLWDSLPQFTSSAPGVVPASYGGSSYFLRADGVWAFPPATSAAGSANDVQINNGGSFGVTPYGTVKVQSSAYGPRFELSTSGAPGFGGQRQAELDIDLARFVVTTATAYPFQPTVVFQGVGDFLISTGPNGVGAISAKLKLLNYQEDIFVCTRDGDNYYAVIFHTDTGNVSLQQPGAGISITEGANCKQGVVTLSGGSAVVTNNKVTAYSRIQLTGQDDNGGSPGFLRVSARTPGTSFTITSSDAGDTSIVAYFITEPS
jgi:hypothetical protein